MARKYRKLSASKPTANRLASMSIDALLDLRDKVQAWPAPGSEDTELGVLMGPEVGHGEAEVHARVQA